MRHVSRLRWLALAAVRRAPDVPPLLAAHAAEAAPELRRDAGIRRLAEQAARQFAVFDLERGLAAELEVDALVVNAPAAVVGEQEALAHAADQLVEAQLAGVEVHVAHAHNRQ